MKHKTFVVAVLLAGLSGCGGPPQLGQNEASFKAVDALYTAVSLRDLRLLDRCKKSLEDLRANETLTPAASKSLQAIIAQAEAGKWETAQGRLGDFMRGQRR